MRVQKRTALHQLLNLCEYYFLSFLYFILVHILQLLMVMHHVQPSCVWKLILLVLSVIFVNVLYTLSEQSPYIICLLIVHMDNKNLPHRLLIKKDRQPEIKIMEWAGGILIFHKLYINSELYYRQNRFNNKS